MFNTARFKLTAWYLLIITIVSVSFSLFIYGIMSTEIDRFSRSQRVRILREYQSPGPTQPTFNVIYFDASQADQLKRRLLLTLVVINSAIVAASGALGYFLAGRTLDPIKVMIDDQNRFISDSSHELRTPLTSLKSSLEVNLRDPKLKLKDARQLIHDSIVEVDRLTTLSNDLLSLTRFQQKNSTQFTSVDLPSVIATSIKRLKPQAVDKKIKIINRTGHDSVLGHQDLLIQLFTILLDNAIKYSHPDSKIEIYSESQDKQVKIYFKDSGIGIASSDIPKIFDRFYRADAARTHQSSGGFGLGLSIAKKIINDHRGNISVRSRLGQGTTFIVTLPKLS